MPRLEHPATAVFDARKVVTTAATRVQLTTVPTAVRSLVIQAETDNTGLIAVGGSTVIALVGTTARGISLSAGQSVSLDIDNLSKIYIDSTVSGDGVLLTYTT
jgi:hypothetical protein